MRRWQLADVSFQFALTDLCSRWRSVGRLLGSEFMAAVCVVLWLLYFARVGCASIGSQLLMNLRGCLNRKEAGKVSSRGSVQDYRHPTPTLCTVVNNKNTRGSQVVGLNSACWRLMVACLTSPEVVAS